MTKYFRLMSVLASLTVTLTACSTDHEFRVGAVGDDSAQPNSESATIAGSAPLLVVAGNILLGSASQVPLVSGPGTASGVVDGTVSAVLLTTGQSLIQLSDGASLLVNSTSGTLGDLVSVNLGTGQVVGGSPALIGANVLGTNSTGVLSGSTLGTSSGTMIGSSTGTVSNVLPTLNPGSALGTQPIATTILQPVTGPVGGTTGTVTGTVGSLCC